MRQFAIGYLFQAIAVFGAVLPAAAHGALIISGHSIGSLRLGDRDSVLKKLGRTAPGHEGDTAMGRSWIQYSSRDGIHSLWVYTTRDETGLITTVRQVRVDSPYFRTKQGVHTGDSLTQILRSFPHAKLVARFTTSKKRVDVYDDTASGIAFEFKPASTPQRELCAAIVIHPRGSNVTQEYMPMYEPLAVTPS